jgi:hypothetical protein
MKHATPDTLTRYAELLAALRALPLKEKGVGKFYRGSVAFLHFHEDAAGLFADLKVGKEWERARVVTKSEQRELLRRVRGMVEPA